MGRERRQGGGGEGGGTAPRLSTSGVSMAAGEPSMPPNARHAFAGVVEIMPQDSRRAILAAVAMARVSSWRHHRRAACRQAARGATPRVDAADGGGGEGGGVILLGY